jgi:hypothetical protein
MFVLESNLCPVELGSYRKLWSEVDKILWEF